jgi:hypothetical protein
MTRCGTCYVARLLRSSEQIAVPDDGARLHGTISERRLILWNEGLGDPDAADDQLEAEPYVAGDRQDVDKGEEEQAKQRDLAVIHIVDAYCCEVVTPINNEIEVVINLNLNAATTEARAVNVTVHGFACVACPDSHFSRLDILL